MIRIWPNGSIAVVPFIVSAFWQQSGAEVYCSHKSNKIYTINFNLTTLFACYTYAGNMVSQKKAIISIITTTRCIALHSLVHQLTKIFIPLQVFWTLDSSWWRILATEKLYTQLSSDPLKWIPFAYSSIVLPSNTFPNSIEQSQIHHRKDVFVHLQSSFWRISAVQPGVCTNSMHINNVPSLRSLLSIDSHKNNTNTNCHCLRGMTLKPCKNSNRDVELPSKK